MTKIEELIKSIKYGPHLKTEIEGDIKYLKGNQFDDDFQLTPFQDSYVKLQDKENKLMLQEDDVIIAAKGFRNYAWRYTQASGPCVASSLFYVIKVDSEIIKPEYFTLVMNSPRIQHKLRTIGLGATIPSIPKSELLRITIFLPSLAEQGKIIEIYNTINKGIMLQREILEKQLTLKNGLINKITKNELTVKKSLSS